MIARAGHEVAITEASQRSDRAERIRVHLEQILDSQMFRGSHRSQEFLRYIVEKSLSGDLNGIKERVLGVEIFGRPLTYDTSADAIVRVTANDVRKRLLRYYELEGARSELRVHLPSGSYMPEFTEIQLEIAQAPSVSPAASAVKYRKTILRLALIAGVSLVFILGFWAGSAVSKLDRPAVPRQIGPWPAIFQSARQTELVFSDASIEMLQAYLHTRISLSDYANHRLLPDVSSMSVDAQRAARMLGGPDFTVTAAPVDLRIAANISRLAQSWSHDLTLRSARELQLRDFKSDANFILLGSPRSNPWTALFQDQMDFSFVFDSARGREVCRNRHPKPGELPVYVPTALGGATGESFAIAAFISNPGQEGNILILAGTDAEGTEAAAKFVISPKLLAKTLRKYDIDPAGPPRHFEALLKLTTLDGSPNRVEVIALHSIR